MNKKSLSDCPLPRPRPGPFFYDELNHVNVPLEIRVLEERDTKCCIALRAQASKENPRDILGDLEHDLLLFESHLTKTVTQGTGDGPMLWGAYVSNLLVGTLAISPRFNVQILNYLWLWGLYVRPRYRGTPVSRLLMETALAWCEEEPAEHRLLSSCRESNEKGMNFLSRWRFEPFHGATFSRNTAELKTGHTLFERGRNSFTGFATLRANPGSKD